MQLDIESDADKAILSRFLSTRFKATRRSVKTQTWAHYLREDGMCTHAGELLCSLVILGTWFGCFSIKSLESNKTLISQCIQKMRASGVSDPSNLAVFQTCMHDKVDLSPSLKHLYLSRFKISLSIKHKLTSVGWHASALDLLLRL
jgi:hypothetical protein